MKNKELVKVLGISAVALAALTAPMAVNAAENQTTGDEKATVELEQGEFSLKTAAVNGFGQHKIEKQAKTVTTGFADVFNVIDARGTQEGWNVTVSATPFKVVTPEGGFAQGTSAYTLPLGSLSLAGVDGIVGVHGEDAAIHPVKVNNGAAIDIASGAVKVVSADAGKGMGEYNISYDDKALSLVIDPTTARIDKVNYPSGVTPYESTLTWNLVTGP